MAVMSFLCVLCRSALGASSESHTCRNAPAEATEYPDVGGVRVMLPGASAVLAASLSRLSAEREMFDARSDSPPTLQAASPEETARKFRVARETEDGNLAVLERHCQPIGDYLGEERTILSGLSGAVAVQLVGSSVSWVLPYCFQDWGGTPAFAAARERMVGAAKKHAHERGAVAVLGCAAGGLAHALAGHFDRSFGVDLSVPALLLAKHLLDGGDLDLSVHTEHHVLSMSPKLTVRGAETPASNVSLLAADIADLPFADESLSCVVTQYVMGVIPDAGRVIAEINRVLRPGGIWIDYGPPYKLAADPAYFRGRTEADVPALLDGFGFSTLESRTLRADYAQVTPHSPLADAEPVPLRSEMRQVHPVIYSVGRRERALPRDPVVAAFGKYFAGDPEPARALTPKRNADEPMVCLLGSEMNGNASRVRSVFGFGPRRFNPLSPSVTNPPMLASLLHACLQRMNGVDAVGEIADELYLESSGMLTERDIVLSLRLLRNQGFLDLA